MSKKVYYNNGASLMRSYARQYKDREDNMARVSEGVDNMIPRNYAAFALVLSREYGFDQDKLTDIIVKTQELYNDSFFDGFDILKVCSEETGIDMYGEVHAKRYHVKGDLYI